MIVHILALLAIGLMCGSELNVAAFSHPVLNRQPIDVHVSVRSSLAVTFGRVMPLWMGGSMVLNVLLLLPFQHLNGTAWRFAAIAFAIQLVTILFSVSVPVPINNQISKWKVGSLPENWREMERRWDVYHWLRTFGLVIAFVLLILSLVDRVKP